MNNAISEPLAVLLQSFAQQQTEGAVRLMSSKRPGNDAVHQIRKTCKRVRALIVLLREPLGRGHADELENLFRLGGRTLGTLRESAVRLQTLDGLEARHPAQTEALRGVRHLLALRSDNSTAPETVTTSRSYLKAAQEAIASLALPPLDPAMLERALTASYRRTRHALHGVDDANAESVHAWRKKLRRHTDQCKLLAPLWPALTGKRRRTLQKVNDALGDHHDLDDLRNQIARSKADLKGRDAVLQLLTDEQAALIGKARRHANRLLTSKAAHWSAAAPCFR